MPAFLSNRVMKLLIKVRNCDCRELQLGVV
jgi:hypothetical protein